MKGLEISVGVLVGMAAGMVAGACVVMSSPEARKVYRCGKRRVVKMLHL